jgi:hypothetical protein
MAKRLLTYTNGKFVGLVFVLASFFVVKLILVDKTANINEISSTRNI